MRQAQMPLRVYMLGWVRGVPPGTRVTLREAGCVFAEGDVHGAEAMRAAACGAQPLRQQGYAASAQVLHHDRVGGSGATDTVVQREWRG
eukprot:m.173698 g.173698  ORF g.173698 m.173698 type:complete len:89 (+) comp18309_c0_seq1:1732-1998(+)